jgi:hypothetical protein
MKMLIASVVLILMASHAQAQSVVVDGASVRIDAPGASVHVGSSPKKTIPAKPHASTGGAGGDNFCSAEVQKFMAMNPGQPQPVVYPARGQSELNLGHIKNAVVCAQSQASVRIKSLQGLVFLVAKDQSSIEVKSGHAIYLVASTRDQASVHYTGESEDAQLTAADQSAVSVGRVSHRPVIQQSDQSTVDVAP